ncbi:hypothetical protein BSKO_12278 [Bryopsis sp. KO-2023]|nr:hypothetical protein BSKO_12278 [Bryopsis sp. KO-2023]
MELAMRTTMSKIIIFALMIAQVCQGRVLLQNPFKGIPGFVNFPNQNPPVSFPDFVFEQFPSLRPVAPPMAGPTPPKPILTPPRPIVPVPVPSPVLPPTPAPVGSTSAAVNDFGFDVLRELRKGMPAENVVFSPFSISSAFSLLYFGTKGATRTEIEQAFGFQNGVVPRALLETARRFGGNATPSSGPTVNIANRAYIDDGFRVLDSYRTAVGTDAFRVVDFANAMASKDEINDFVDMLTRGLIKDLIPDGFITPSTQAVLVNAIYFKAMWVKAFNKDDTRKSEFRGTGGSSMTDFMSIRGETFPTKNVPQLDGRMLQLPYEGDRFSMFILLPNTDGGFSKAEAGLTSSLNLFKNLTPTKFALVKIPKWELEQSMKMLKNYLMALGVKAAFSGQADLSGLSDVGSLSVSDVVHRAKIIVDEEGTEAAAATAIGIVRTSLPVGPPPPQFVADHPFLFFIVDTKAGDVFFQGTVTSF